MNGESRCPSCGRSLSADAGVGGLCAACLLRLAAVTGTGASFYDEPAATCRVISVLGGSAHGSCYLADRPEGGRRVFVVLKTIDCDAPPGFDDRMREIRERVHAVAHDGVAALRGHGVTASRQPYFLFDYVRGLAITAHCAKFSLARGERLALAERVDAILAAIHHADLVHGAVSASNILVTGVPGAWEPRVLDLGVRAALGPLLPGTDDGAAWARLRGGVLESMS